MSAGDAYAALGYIAAGLILLGVAAIAASILRRPRHVPGLPARGRIRLTDEEVMEKYLGILLNLHETADEPERSA